MADFYIKGKKVLTPDDIYMTNQEIVDSNWTQKRNIHYLKQDENGKYYFDLYAEDLTSWGVMQNHIAINSLSQRVATLEKQIGGVIRPAINYWRKASSHLISLEVA